MLYINLLKQLQFKISMKDNNLEDIVLVNEPHIIKQSMPFLLRHPLLISSGLSAFFYSLSENPDHAEIQFLVEAGSLTYLSLRAFNDYFIERRSIRLKDSKELPSRLGGWLLDNPVIVSAGILVAGITSGAYFMISNQHEPMEEILREYTFLLTPVNAALADITIRGIKNARKIKKGVQKLVTKRLESIYNHLYEHPIAVGIGAGASRFIYDVTTKFLPGAYSTKPEVSGSYASWFAIGSTVTLITGLAAGSIPVLLGSLFHSHSLKLRKHKIKRVWHSFHKDKAKAIEEQRKLLEIPDSLDAKINGFVKLGELEIKNGEIENGFSRYRKALRLFDKKEDSETYSSFFNKAFLINDIASTKKYISGKYFLSDIILDLLRKDHNAVRSLGMLAQSMPNDYISRYIYGKALEIIGEKELGRREKLIAIRKILEEKPEETEIKGSKNRVILIEDGFLKTEIIKKHGSLEDLKAEIARTEEAQEVLRNFEDYYTPRPIGIDQESNQPYYLIEREDCKFLDQRIREDKSSLDEFLRVADYVGLINAKIKKDIGKERNAKETIELRMNKLVDPILLSLLLDNLQPVLYASDAMPKVYNKDARPANIGIMDNEDLFGIDFEGGRFIPVTHDTANMLGDHRFLDRDKRFVLADAHRRSFMRYSKIKLSKRDFMLAYLNSTIIRALEVYSQVIPEEIKRRESWLLNARDAIEIMQKEFPSEYERNRKEYGNLRVGISKLL